MIDKELLSFSSGSIPALKLICLSNKAFNRVNREKENHFSTHLFMDFQIDIGFDERLAMICRTIFDDKLNVKDIEDIIWAHLG